MYRGTTPTITIKINSDIDLSEVAECWVTFDEYVGSRQKTFDISDITIDSENKQITIEMTQDDTLFFNEGMVTVQIRVRLNDGTAYASAKKDIVMNGILKDGVI